MKRLLVGPEQGFLAVDAGTVGWGDRRDAKEGGGARQDLAQSTCMYSATKGTRTHSSFTMSEWRFNSSTHASQECTIAGNARHVWDGYCLGVERTPHDRTKRERREKYAVDGNE